MKSTLGDELVKWKRPNNSPVRNNPQEQIKRCRVCRAIWKGVSMSARTGTEENWRRFDPRLTAIESPVATTLQSTQETLESSTTFQRLRCLFNSARRKERIGENCDLQHVFTPKNRRQQIRSCSHQKVIFYGTLNVFTKKMNTIMIRKKTRNDNGSNNNGR